jgi:hypothetical protein
MTERLNRRSVLSIAAAGITVTAAGCTSGGDSDGGGSGSDWDFEQTYTQDREDMVKRGVIGELEDGDEVEVEVVVNSGTQSGFSLINLDSGEIIADRRVYRDSRLDQYDEDNEEHVASPWRHTFTVTDFGEYAAEVRVPANNIEVVLRFRTL